MRVSIEPVDKGVDKLGNPPDIGSLLLWITWGVFGKRTLNFASDLRKHCARGVGTRLFSGVSPPLSPPDGWRRLHGTTTTARAPTPPRRGPRPRPY